MGLLCGAVACLRGKMIGTAYIAFSPTLISSMGGHLIADHPSAWALKNIAAEHRRRNAAWTH